MDFKTCPSCGASILDDEADECPSCGESLSGKPRSAGAAAKTAAAPKQASAGGAATSAAPSETSPDAAKAAPGRKTAAEGGRSAARDEAADPFEVDTRSIQKAVPVSRKPAKGRMYRIVCPMCETPGFISEKHAGKDVKCANPDCLVPVFTAPVPEKPEEEPEPAKGVSGTVFTVAAILLVGGVAFALWHFVLKGETGPERPLVETPVTPVEPEESNGPDDGEETAPVEPAGPPPVPLAEVQATALDEVVDAARQRNSNRSKPFGRRLASEAFADVGDLEEAVAQLEAMRRVPGYEPFYEIEPWTLIARRRRASGDETGAAEALENALQKAGFPTTGRQSLDAAGALAAALARAGRLEEAAEIARTQSDASLRGRLSTLWRGAIDSQSFEFADAAARPDLVTMPNPQWVTVTRTLFFLGETDAALEWARSAEEPAVRDNAAATWAAELLLAASDPGDPQTLQRLDQIAEPLGDSGQVRLWAAAAHAQQMRRAPETAVATLQNAVDAAGRIDVPEEPHPVPDMAAVYHSDGTPRAGLPDPGPNLAAALALIDVAQLQSEAGDGESAWAFVQAALNLLRATTPSPAATQQLVDECEGAANIAGVKRRLQSVLDIDENRVFLAFNQYRAQCRELNDLAWERFNLQTELLERAASWGLLSEVWQEVEQRSTAAERNQREPYLQTSLPGLVAGYAAHAGNSELANAVAQALMSRPVPPPRLMLELQFADAVEADDIERATNILRTYQNRSVQEPYPLHLATLQAVDLYVRAGRHERALEFVANVPAAPAREDAYWVIAATSVRDGNHSAVWRYEGLHRLSATETAALHRGFIDGLDLAPTESADVEVAEN